MWLESLELDVDSLSSTYCRVRVMKVAVGPVSFVVSWRVEESAWEEEPGEAVPKWFPKC